MDPSGLRWAGAAHLARNRTLGLWASVAGNIGGGGAIGGPAKTGRLLTRPGYGLGGGGSQAAGPARRPSVSFGSVRFPSPGPLEYHGPTYSYTKGGDGGATTSLRSYDQPKWAQGRKNALNHVTDDLRRNDAGNCTPTGTPEKGFWEGLKEHLKPGEIVPYLWHEAKTNPYLNQKISPQEGLKFALMGAGVVGALIITGGAAAVPILIGAGIGAGIGYGAQVHQNLQHGMELNEALSTNINPLGIVQGAMHGAFSAAVAAVVEPLLPGGGSVLTRVLMSGATEFISGRATQVALNLVSGERWDANLWNPQDPQWQLDVLLDVVPGVGAGLLGEAWHALKAARAAKHADLPSVSGLDDAVDVGKYADDIDTLHRLSPEEWDALAVRKAWDVIQDPNASMLQKWTAQNVLLDAGVPGIWQGGISLNQVRESLPPVRWDPGAKQWYDTGKGHRFISFEDAQAQGRRFIVDDLPGRAVDIDEAARLSGIPRDHLEKLIDVHRETQTIGGYRTVNEKFGDVCTQTWPKDPNAKVFHPVDTDKKLKISSQANPRFKTTEHGIVGTRLKIDGDLVEYGVVRRSSGEFELMDMTKIVDTEGNIILDPGLGIPMGPDIDTYFFLQKTDSGYVNLGTDTPGELAIRELAGRATSDYRPAIGSDMSPIMHGPAQPFQPLTKWGDGLVVMPDGQLVWLKQREVDAFFQYHGLSSKQEGPSGVDVKHFRGTEKPWTGMEQPSPRRATPNSIYTQFNPETGRPVQSALYDPNGLVLAHVDWKQHGVASPGHFHWFSRPGDPSSGHTHGPDGYYDPVDPQALKFPNDWDVWP